MRRTHALSLPVTASLSVALVAASLTAITVRDVASAPDVQAANLISQQVGFNARAWTMTQPDANGIRYVGGDFTSVNAWNTGKGAWVDPATGDVDPTFNSVSATSEGGVQASVPDGSGGVYVAGGVSAVGGTGRNNVAHVLPDGSVDPTFVPPSINNEIWAIAVDADAIYIGGKFTSVDGQTRNNVAALDRTTGALLNWNPNANGWVMALHVDASNVYLGGRFTTLSGASRTYAAAVRTGARTTAAGTCLDSYDDADCLTAYTTPITGGYGVFEFAQDGTDMYVGGDISATSGGTTITTLIRTDAATGTMDTTWNPTIAGTGARIYDMDIAGTTLYVGGRFATVGGVARSRVAAFDLANNAALDTTWVPTTSAGGVYNYNGNIELNDAVSVVEASGGKVYIAGGIFAINGEARNRVGAVDATTGALEAFDPHACDWTNGVASHVRTVSDLGSRVFVGGNFDCMGGLKRYHAAAVGSDGILTDWNPQVNASVQAMSSDGTTIFMVGRFTAINDQPRQYAGAVQVNETVTGWNPTLERGLCDGGETQTVLQTASAVYVGGCFTTVGGQARPRLAKTDRATGAVDLGFNANPGAGWIRALAHEGSRLYVGGLFSTMGGQTRSWIAAVDDSTGAVDMGWDAGPIVAAHDAAVRTAIYDIEPSSDDTRLYIAGFFGTINGESQRFLAALDKSTGALDTSWRPVVAPQACSGWNCGLMSVDQYDDTVYIAGASGNPVAGTAFGAVSAIDGSVSTWMNASGTGEVRGISVNDATAFIAGSFSSVAGNTRLNTAAIDLRGPVLAPWPMSASEAAPLTVSITAPDDTTSGAVVSNPGGINCGGTCEYAYPTTQTVTLEAVPKPAADFAGWTGACSGSSTTCTVSMSAARSAVATFVPVGSAPAPSPSPSASPSPSPSPSASPSPSPSASPSPSSSSSAQPNPVLRAPGAPQSVRASVSGTTATVTWSPPSDRGSAPISTYRVTASPGGATCLATSTTCDVTGLEPGVAYTFTVVALNAAGWGSPSESSAPTVAPVVEISAGPRTVEGRRDRVTITGTVAGLAPGTVLVPYVKLDNARAEAIGRARIVIGEGGSITWSRQVRPFRRVAVHFRADGVRSNVVSWQPIR